MPMPTAPATANHQRGSVGRNVTAQPIRRPASTANRGSDLSAMMWAMSDDETPGTSDRGLPLASDIEFRQLRSVVGWHRGFLAVATVFLVGWSLGVAADGYWFWSPIGIAMLVVIGVVTVRYERVGITAEGDELRVRNFFREHRLSRAEIEAFSVSTDPFFFKREGLLIHMSGGRFLRPTVMRPIRQMSTRPDLAHCQHSLSQWRLGVERAGE